MAWSLYHAGNLTVTRAAQHQFLDNTVQLLDNAQLYVTNGLKEYFVSNCATVWGPDTVHQWYFFERHKKRNAKPLRVWVSNKIKLSLLLTCFYGQYMVVCYMFLGDPPDTVEEGVTSLRILNFTEKIFCELWVPGRQLLNAQLMQMGMVCFCSFSASMNCSWGQTTGTRCLLDFILEFCYLRQAGRNPNISLLY